MSYTVGFEADLGGHEPFDLDVYLNITSNVAPMWRKAGVDLRDLNGAIARNCVPLLRSAIENMSTYPGVYETMNPENGWGDVRGCVDFLRDILDVCERAPKARMRVHW